jgi:hypothetical protein
VIESTTVRRLLVRPAAAAARNLLRQQPLFPGLPGGADQAERQGLLSRDITVRDLILNRCDVHHLFPRNLLKKQALSRGRYNQIANYALAQSEINITIGDKAPSVYFPELLEQCQGGKKRYGGITDPDDLLENLTQHCIPAGIFDGLAEDYSHFLDERRKLMAAKIKTYYGKL